MNAPSLPTSGLVAVSVTPLTATGAVDLPGVQTLMDFYVRSGVTGVTLLGVMGEANRMTEAEGAAVVKATVAGLAGRAAAIVGVSDTSLERLTASGRAAMAAGAAGVMVQPLSGLLGDEAVVRYFRAVTTALGPDIPVCFQDFPKASGVHLSPGAWRGIVDSCPSVVMLKHEDDPGLNKLTAIRAAEAAGLRRVTILVGNNGIALPQELRRGADGAMTGFAFPDVLASVCAQFDAGADQAGEDLFDRYLPLNRHELRGGLGIRKELLRRRGALATNVCRHPLAPLTPADLAEIDQLLERLDRTPAVEVGELVNQR